MPIVVEGRDLQDAWVVKIDDALVLVFLQQGVEHGAGLRAVFGEHVALADIVGALAAGERRLVKGDVADEVEGVEVLADFVGEWLERQPSSSSSSMIACLRSADFQRFRKSSRLAKRFFRAFFVKSRRLSVTSLPFSSRYSTRSATIVAATPST